MEELQKAPVNKEHQKVLRGLYAPGRRMFRFLQDHYPKKFEEWLKNGQLRLILLRKQRDADAREDLLLDQGLSQPEVDEILWNEILGFPELETRDQEESDPMEMAEGIGLDMETLRRFLKSPSQDTSPMPRTLPVKDESGS